MKRIFAKTLLLSALLLPFTMSIQAAPESFKLDPSHTYVLWHINHFGFSNPSGKWMANGTLTLDEKNPQNSQLNVMIQMAAVDTGIPELDTHLKSNAFLDVVQFPIATFLSDKVQLTSKTTAKVHGLLTVHGVTKPVTLDVKLNKMGVSPITKHLTAGFTASTQVKRSDFGITAYLPGLSDDVKLDIEAEAAKAG